MNRDTQHIGFWGQIWKRFKGSYLGMIGLLLLSLFFIAALFAPFFASSLPLFFVYDGTEVYFPLFRYLVVSTYFTKKIDIFFNLLGLLFFPFLASFLACGIKRTLIQISLGVIFIFSFIFFGFYFTSDPALSGEKNRAKEELILQLGKPEEDFAWPREREELPSWDIDLSFMTDYAKRLLVIRQINNESRNKKIREISLNIAPYTLWEIHKEQEKALTDELQKKLDHGKKEYDARIALEQEMRTQVLTPKLEAHLSALEEENRAYEVIENRLQYIQDKRAWIEQEKSKYSHIVMPLLRPFHYEEEAGGEQALNLELPFYEQTRTTRRDLVAALIFGARISLFVGFAATILLVAIGVTFGLLSGFYGGKGDLLFCRFVEVWESLPAFFLLLFIMAILETKSIFIIIFVIALFGWTQVFRFVRAETFRERSLPYVDATRALGFPDRRILFYHILPNALLAVLALLPFDIMSAITVEAALAFLGLGEEQSSSWGVLMDEGRSVFPAFSGLLWPPAIVLTVLLIAIAFVGEALQRAMNPKVTA